MVEHREEGGNPFQLSGTPAAQQANETPPTQPGGDRRRAGNEPAWLFGIDPNRATQHRDSTTFFEPAYPEVWLAGRTKWPRIAVVFLLGALYFAAGNAGM